MLSQSLRSLVVLALECQRHGDALVARRSSRAKLEEAMRTVALALTALHACTAALREPPE